MMKKKNCFFDHKKIKHLNIIIIHLPTCSIIAKNKTTILLCGLSSYRSDPDHILLLLSLSLYTYNLHNILYAHVNVILYYIPK